MRRFSFRPSLTLRGRKFKGLRGWAGKPLHPPLTDVPVGAYILAAGFDVISFVGGDDEAWARDFYRAASFALIGGALVSVFGFNITCLSQFPMGALGMMRRYYNYDPMFAPYHHASTIGAWIAGIGFVIEGHRHQIYGRCRACVAAGAEPRPASTRLQSSAARR